MPTAAILGANSNRKKFGNKSLRAHEQAGFTVFPIHPVEEIVEGHRVFKSVSEVPTKIDRISAYVPPAALLTLLEEIGRVGCSELWLNPGTDTEEVIQRAKELGINAVVGCSIIDVGFSPSEL